MKKNTLADIFSHHVTTLSPDASVSEAIDLMAKQQLSSLIIVDSHYYPMGIFTERDSLKVVSGEIQLALLLGDIAKQQKLLTAHRQDEIHDAYMTMSEQGYRHLIVVDDEGRLEGVVTQGDFLRHMGFDGLTKVKRVADVMTKNIVMLDQHASISQAAEQMSEHRSAFAIVVNQMNPIGLVTERDILRYASSNPHFGSQTPLSLIYQTNFPVIHEDTPLPDAATMMEQHGVHQIVIADAHNKLIGLLTRYDLLQALHGSYFEFLIRQIDSKSNALTELKDIYSRLLEDKERLAKSEAKFHALFELLHDGVVLVDTATHLAADFNTAAASQLGYTREEFATLRINDYDAIESTEETKEHVRLVLEQGGQFEFETLHRHKSGKLLNTLVRVTPMLVEGKAHLLAYYRDITEQKKYESQLEYVANYDALTGLANRSLLQSQLKRIIDKTNWNATCFALIIFDLDRFKDINDSFGHTAGDELLVQVSERLRELVQGKYLLSRMGGDEFALVIDDLPRPEDAAIVADQIIAALSRVYRLTNKLDVHISASAGIGVYPDHGITTEQLIQHADAALYRAKSEGRNTYRYYSDALTQLAHHRITMETKLRQAITNQELRVFYQPQVHIATGRIIGAEALVRWQHPTEGMIMPDAFIPLAEESGLIDIIGEWVLRETCTQGKRWLDQGHRLTLAVNLSAHQLWQQDVPALVAQVLKETDYPGSRLELELTESALMRHEETTVTTLHALRAMEIRLAIDDFGTGYSSLSYLKRFPIDVLKIDKSFVDELPFDKEDIAITKAIIAMAKALNFSVLAEGVERSDQLALLQAEGCDLFQGYYSSRPISASAFSELLIQSAS